MIDQHNHWQDFVEWFHEHFPLIFGLVATVVSGIIWALHERFVTHKNQAKCKSDVLESIEEHENEWIRLDQSAHDRIWGKIEAIDQKVDRIMQMMIEWPHK